MIPSASWRYWRFSDPFCSERSSKNYQCFWMARTTPENCPLTIGDLHPHVIRGSLGPPESSSKMASRSAVFAQLTVECPVTLQWAAKFSPQNCPLTLLVPIPGAHPNHHPIRHLDRFSRFCMGFKCCAVQCIVSGKDNPKNRPFPLEYCNPARGEPSHDDKQYAKNGKDRACGSRTDRQTDRHLDVLITIFRHRSGGQSKKDDITHHHIAWMSMCCWVVSLLSVYLVQMQSSHLNIASPSHRWKKRSQGHLSTFKFWGLIISLDWVKRGISNLVCWLIPDRLTPDEDVIRVTWPLCFGK